MASNDGIRGVRALVLLASRPETVEIAASRLGPEVLGLMFSQESLEAVMPKCLELRAGGTAFRYRMVDDPMEIGDAFSKFELMLADLEDLGYGRAGMLLDATGGTTPMRLGAALAAMTRGIGMVHQQVPQRYVNGRWERDESRGVQVALMRNPLEATGLLREGQAVQLFNRGDYAAAALVFEDIAGKVSGAERGHYYGGLLLLAEGYAAWDAADYKTALGKLKEARGELGVELSEVDLAQRAGNLSGEITAHLPFLGKAQGGKLNAENVVDMLENARRRIRDQGRYDDGVARLYRTVEMWHQFRLQEVYSVSTNGPDWSKVPEEARRRFLEATGLAELPGLLDLTRARTLDRILGGEALEEDAVFRDLLQQRNRSILAHGLEPIGQRSAARFLDLVDAMVDAPEARVGAEHVRIRGL